MLFARALKLPGHVDKFHLRVQGVQYSTVQYQPRFSPHPFFFDDLPQRSINVPPPGVAPFLVFDVSDVGLGATGPAFSLPLPLVATPPDDAAVIVRKRVFHTTRPVQITIADPTLVVGVPSCIPVERTRRELSELAVVTRDAGHGY